MAKEPKAIKWGGRVYLGRICRVLERREDGSPKTLQVLEVGETLVDEAVLVYVEQDKAAGS